MLALKIKMGQDQLYWAVFQVVIVIFAVVAVTFIPIGAVSLAAANNVVEITERYDDSCFDEGLNADSNRARDLIISESGGNASTTCTIEIDVDEKMDEPVYVYYELDNFYQNHRRYVRSRSDLQNRDGPGDHSRNLDF